jgi:hypothetical protein
VLVPALSLGFLEVAIVAVIGMDRRKRDPWPEGFSAVDPPALKKLFKLVTVSA